MQYFEKEDKKHIDIIYYSSLPDIPKVIIDIPGIEQKQQVIQK